MKGKAFFSCMGNNHKVPPSITTNWPPSDRYLQPTGNMHFWMFSPTLWFGKNQVLQNPTNWWASITVSSRISSQWLLQCFQCNCLSSPQTLTRLQKKEKKSRNAKTQKYWNRKHKQKRKYIKHGYNHNPKLDLTGMLWMQLSVYSLDTHTITKIEI